MLVLRTKIDKTIVLDGNIFLTLRQREEGEFEFAIDAPRDIQIDRLEVHRRKEATRAKGIK